MVPQSIKAITEASKGLKNAKHFKELLNLILMLGNYMNGGGHNGGAFGFKIASINKVASYSLFTAKSYGFPRRRRRGRKKKLIRQTNTRFFSSFPFALAG